MRLIARHQITRYLIGLLLFVFLSACSPAPVAPEPSATTAVSLAPSPTLLPPSPTPLPPTDTPNPPTSTLTPTITQTSPPTETPAPSETPTETSPPPTASGEDAIYVYYIQKDTGGPVACGDSLIKVNTGAYRSGDNEADITTALHWLFNKQQYIGNLYNPIFRSTWNITSVNFKSYEGLADISLDGAYVRSGDRCDDSRVRAQIWTTIRQFSGVKTVYILLNGNLLGDILATGK